MSDPNPIEVATGAKVRQVRERQRMSQTILGEAIGVSFQQVQKYERGANRISVSMLHAIAQALGVSPADFLETRTTRQAAGCQFVVIAEDDIDGAVLRIGLQHFVIGPPRLGISINAGAVEVMATADLADIDGIIAGLQRTRAAAKPLRRTAGAPARA